MAQAMKVPVVIPEGTVRRAVDELMRPWLPISVTVDDEHARPVTGYLLRLPEEMGGGWVASLKSIHTEAFPSSDAIRRRARIEQEDVGLFVPWPLAQAELYAQARWWAEAYRVALREERAA